MLYVTFKEPKKYVFNPDSQFKTLYNPKWFEDDFVKRAVLAIDKTEVVAPYLMMSPIYGPMPPDMLSTGVKNVILTKYTDSIKRGGCFGDNCTYWIGEISKQKDIML